MKNVQRLLVFDVDGTLCVSQRPVSQETKKLLKSLSNEENVAIALVSGSDETKVLKQFDVKSKEELMRGYSDSPECPSLDYILFENGLMAYSSDGCGNCVKLHEGNVLHHLGEESYQELVNWILNKFSSLQIPKKRGHFVELRHATINVSPIGRSCSVPEREEFYALDEAQGIRMKLRNEIQERFGTRFALETAIGGQISIDIYPKGWNKSFILGVVPYRDFNEVHFFGDRCFPGGNDYPLFIDKRVSHPHSVQNVSHTQSLMKQILDTPMVEPFNVHISN